MANLNQDQLRRLARLGAVARLQQLRDEEAAIRAEFPELFGGTRSRTRKAARAEAPTAAGNQRPRRRRRKMTAEERKAVSERMRKYWAERRRKGAKA